jgi:hypothetical protein
MDSWMMSARLQVCVFAAAVCLDLFEMDSVWQHVNNALVC